MTVHAGTVLRLLRDIGPQSRADLARRSGLSAATMTNLTAQLVEAGTISEGGAVPVSAPGRPSVRVALNAGAQVFAGVHIGAGRVWMVLCDLRARVLASDDFAYADEVAPLALCEPIAERVRGLARGIGLPPGRIAGLGVAVPGSVDAARRVCVLSVVMGWQEVPFADALEAELRIPTILENHVPAMALAERFYGLGRVVQAGAEAGMGVASGAVAGAVNGAASGAGPGTATAAGAGQGAAAGAGTAGGGATGTAPRAARGVEAWTGPQTRPVTGADTKPDTQPQPRPGATPLTAPAPMTRPAAAPAMAAVSPAVLCLSLGRGLGAGLVSDDRVFRPGGHGAVELGHVQIDAHGAPCRCGSRGCLETLFTALPPDGLADPDVRARLLPPFITALANAVNMLSPDVIVFCGRLADAPEEFFEALRREVPGRVMPYIRAGLRIERGSFGRQAGAVGGAAVALEHMLYAGG